MNVLIVGRGKGSWEIRGVQMGAAIGAHVVTVPTLSDLRWADVAVYVKGAAHRQSAAAHLASVPVVWDALDCWRQPSDNVKSEAESLTLLRSQLNLIRPALTLCATQAQAQAAGGVYVPHHTRPGLTAGPVRETVQVVAYEGSPSYLGRWGAALMQACAARGWRFVVNPADLREADILVALRDGLADGWMCREWKSGVKLVNALASGRPVITQVSAALAEIGGPASVVEQFIDIETALEHWRSVESRRMAASQCARLAPAYQLPTVAQQYLAAVRTVATQEAVCR